MKKLRRKISEILIAALCFASIPFMGMPAIAEVPFERLTASDYDAVRTSSVYETATSSCFFKDRNGENQYRVFGQKSGAYGWYKADKDGNLVGDGILCATESDYRNLEPIEYQIMTTVTEDNWQEFYNIASNSVYVEPNSAGGKQLREGYYSKEAIASSDFLAGYPYSAFGAYALTGDGDTPILYMAYGKVLNNGTPETENHWIIFDNTYTTYGYLKPWYTYTVSCKSSAEGSALLDSYAGAVLLSGEKNVSPKKDITGYIKPTGAKTVSADKAKIEFAYTPVSYKIRNYSYDDGKTQETEFSYDANAKQLEADSAHTGYTLEAYKYVVE